MIEISRLQKVIEGRTALDVPALKVSAGEIVALVGPLGSGQAILLDMLIGHSRPSQGEVKLSGIDPQTNPDRVSRLVGVLFEDDGLYDRQTALENLAFHSRLYGLPGSQATKILERIGLSDHAHVRAEKLAPGMKRRLALGRSFLHAPSILLLVDPFARCDQDSISLLSSLLRQLASEGAALLIFADDAANLAAICTTIYTIDQGRLSNSYQPQRENTLTEAPFKVPVRMEGKVALINPSDILYADVEDGRAFLHTHESRLPTQFTLSELEQRLVRSGFFRAHRAYLVNLQHVKEVIPYTRDSFSLRLDDVKNTEIPLSKSAANELKDLLGY